MSFWLKWHRVCFQLLRRKKIPCLLSNDIMNLNKQFAARLFTVLFMALGRKIPCFPVFDFPVVSLWIMSANIIKRINNRF